MNLDSVMKLKKMWDMFKESHPKFPLFLNDIKNRGITENSIIEIHIKYPDSTTIKSNIKVNHKDIELINELRSFF